MSPGLVSLFRYAAGVAVGLVAAVFTWFAIASTHPIFSQVSLSGLVPSLASGVVGGAITGLFAPRRKLMFAGVVGSALTAALLAAMHTRGWYAGNRNPFLWYWPAYVLPSFLLGAALTRRLWRGAA